SLLRCSRCKVARYCSSVCQRADWHEHRDFCLDRDSLFADFEQAHAVDNVGQLSKWLDYWRAPLLRWGVFHADLAHQTESYLADHCFMVVLEGRGAVEMPSPKSLFTPIRAGMCTNEECIAFIRYYPEEQYRDKIVEDFSMVPCRGDVMRIILVCDSYYISTGDSLRRLFADHDPDLFTDRTDAQSRSNSTFLKWIWIEEFVDAVEDGKVKFCDAVLDAMLAECSKDEDGNLPQLHVGM
ncbi:hypothetical protein B0H13DRAFT_2551235, partial [Mycena leptocephala]